MKTAFFLQPSLMILIAFAALVTFSSCDKRIRKQGSGNITTSTRNLTNFTDVDADGSYHLFMHIDDQPRIVITTDDNMINEVQSFVQDGKLFIEMSKDYQNYHFTKMDIHVYAASYNRFDLNGSIESTCEDTITSTSFVSNHNGSGYTHMLFAGENLELNTRGSADIHASGYSTNAKYTINGSGKFDVLNLTCQHADANINGSGEMLIHCTGSLDATIDGSGKIRYTGNPVTTTHISGSGSVAPY